MQRQLRFLQFLRRTLPSLRKTKFAYTFSIETGGTKVPPVFILCNVRKCKCNALKLLLFLAVIEICVLEFCFLRLAGGKKVLPVFL